MYAGVNVSGYVNYNGVYYNYGYFNSYPIFYKYKRVTIKITIIVIYTIIVYITW